MMEIISAAVFDQFFKSSGPQIAIFGRFKEQWKFVDSTKYSAIDVPVIGVKSDLTVGESEWLNQKRTDIIEFLQNYLSRDNQPRQDYLEFIRLTLIILFTYQPTRSLPPCQMDGKRYLLPENLLVP